MERGVSASRAYFWLLALIWLPALYWLVWVFGLLYQILEYNFPFGLILDQSSRIWPSILKYVVLSLFVLGPMGLPPALLCRQFWRSGYRRTARTAWIAMGVATAALLFWHPDWSEFDQEWLLMAVHLLPVWIIVYLAVFSAPLCVAVLLLQQRRTRNTE